MLIQLPKLPYSRNALEPHMSRETLEYHHDKHHKKYVEEANRLIAGTEFEDMSVEEIIRQATGEIFNNVAQSWNHSFFWNCLAPGNKKPSRKLQDTLSHEFGSVSEFTKLFTETATGTFGSGWTWLVKTKDGSLKVVSTKDAANPLTQDEIPLLACDVWEHAYYIDYRNERPKYLKHFWNLANWDFVESNLWASVNAAAA